MTTVLFAGYEKSVEADEYQDRRRQIERREPGSRRVPVIPPKGQQIRVLIDSDAHNEIDDVWAIALAALCPERFQIEGIVAANYDNKRPGSGPASIETSARTVINRDKTFALFDHELKEGVAETVVNNHSNSPAAKNRSQP
ncbi:MAG: hypothetical protein AAGJ40_20370 [Planctomycetota bacterium]